MYMCVCRMEGEREREEGREKGREEGREGGRERGRKGGREEGREGEREGGRAGGGIEVRKLGRTYNLPWGLHRKKATKGCNNNKHNISSKQVTEGGIQVYFHH